MRFFSLFSIPSSYDTYHLTILKNSLSLTCNPDKLGQLSTLCTPRENQLSHGGTFPYFKQASSPSSCFRFSKQSCDFFSLFQVGILRVDKNFTWNLSFLGLRFQINTKYFPVHMTVKIWLCFFFFNKRWHQYKRHLCSSSCIFFSCHCCLKNNKLALPLYAFGRFELNSVDLSPLQSICLMVLQT